MLIRSPQTAADIQHMPILNLVNTTSDEEVFGSPAQALL